MAYTLGLYARFVERIVDDLDLAPVTLVGACVGSAAAMRYSYEHPDRVRDPVLVNTLTSDTIAAGVLGRGTGMTQRRRWRPQRSWCARADTVDGHRPMVPCRGGYSDLCSWSRSSDARGHCSRTGVMMMRFRRSRQAAEARAASFRQCPSCSYDFATGEGQRGCHYYECPYLPEDLDVRCPTCLYNFHEQDGNPECGDPPDCEFAREVAPQRLANLASWTRENRRVVGG